MGGVRRLPLFFSVLVVVIVVGGGTLLLPLDWPGVEPEFAAGPDGEGLIAFVRETEHGPRIFVMRPDGTGVRRLIYEGSSDPAWSPDGTWLAFHTGSDVQPTGIAKVRSDRSGRTTLTAEVGDGSPTWAPDGERLVFLRNPPAEGEPWSWWMMGADGRDQWEVKHVGGSSIADPAWSPFGRTLAVPHKRAYQTRILLLDLEKSRTLWPRRRGAIDGSSPAWSPDGSRIAYIFEDDIWVADLASEGKTNLTRTRGTVESSPAWSPDGRWLVFSATPPSDTKSDIYLMPSRPGEERVRLTDHPSAEGEPAWQPTSGTTPPPCDLELPESRTLEGDVDADGKDDRVYVERSLEPCGYELMAARPAGSPPERVVLTRDGEVGSEARVNLLAEIDEKPGLEMITTIGIFSILDGRVTTWRYQRSPYEPEGPIDDEAHVGVDCVEPGTIVVTATGWTAKEVNAGRDRLPFVRRFYSARDGLLVQQRIERVRFPAEEVFALHGPPLFPELRDPYPSCPGRIPPPSNLYYFAAR